MNTFDKIFSIFTRDFVLFGTSLLTGVVIARFLGPEKLGIWTLLLLIPGYAEAFGRLQLDVSSVYFIGKGKVDLGEAAFILNLVSVVMVTLIFIIGSLNIDLLHIMIFKNSEVNVRNLIYGVSLIIPLRFIYLNYSYLLIAYENIKVYNYLVIIHALVTSFSSVVLITLFDLGIQGALVGNVIGLLVSITYGVYKVNSIARIQPNFNLHLILEMLKYSFHMYLAGLIGFFQNNVSILIASIYIGPAQIAFFAMGKTISEISTRMIPAAVSTILYPRISSSDNDEKSKALVVKLFRLTLLIISLTTIVLCFMIKIIVFVLYGSDYYPVIDIFFIIIAAVVLVQSSSILTNYLTGTGNVYLLPRLGLPPLILQTLLTLFFINSFGIIGLAISYAISSIFLFFLQVISFIKISNMKFNCLYIRYDDVETIKIFLISKVRFFKK